MAPVSIRVGHVLLQLGDVGHVGAVMRALDEGGLVFGPKPSRAAPDLQGLAAAGASILALAADAAQAMSGATIAAGIQKARDGGKALPSHLCRAVRAVDSAAALLRHPGTAEATVAQVRACFSAQAIDGAEDASEGELGAGTAACTAAPSSGSAPWAPPISSTTSTGTPPASPRSPSLPLSTTSATPPTRAARRRERARRMRIEADVDMSRDAGSAGQPDDEGLHFQALAGERQGKLVTVHSPLRAPPERPRAAAGAVAEPALVASAPPQTADSCSADRFCVGEIVKVVADESAKSKAGWSGMVRGSFVDDQGLWITLRHSDRTVRDYPPWLSAASLRRLEVRSVYRSPVSSLPALLCITAIWLGVSSGPSSELVCCLDEWAIAAHSEPAP